MKNIPSIMLPMLILVLVCNQAFAANKDTLIQDTWAKVKSFVGKAEVRNPNSGQWRSVYAGMKIKMNWDVRTQNESSVELCFQSGTVIKLRENSIVSLSTLFDTDNRLVLDKNSRDSLGMDTLAIDVISVTDENRK